MERFFESWARFICRRPWLTVSVCLILAAAGGLLALRIGYDTDQDNLVGSNEDYFHRYKKDYLGNFPDSEYLYVVIDVDGQRDRALAFAEAISQRLRAAPEIEFVRYRFDLSFLEQYPLHLLPQKEFVATSERLLDARDDLRAMAAAQDFGDVFSHINKRMANRTMAGRDEGPGDQEMFLFLDGLLADMEATAEGRTPTGAGIRKAFFSETAGQTQVPFFDTDPRQDPEGRAAKFLFVAIQVKKDFSTLAVIEKPLGEVRRAMDGTLADFASAGTPVSAGLTGRPVLAADEMEQTSGDMTIDIIVSFGLVTLAFIICFMSPWRPLLVMLSLGVGIAWSCGFIFLTVGTLNLLSLVFAIFLVGLGIEFGIHTMARYTEELSKGAAPVDAMAAAMRAAGPGNLMSVSTSAAAFFATMLVDFKGLADLGFIAGAGLLLCYLAMHTILPASLTIFDRLHPRASRKPPAQFRFLGRLENHAPWVAALAVLLTAVSIWLAAGTTFDRNLLNLQDPYQPSVQWERKIRDSGFSTWFAVFLADDDAAARKVVDRLAQEPSLFKRRESIVDLLPPEGRPQALAELAAEIEQDPNAGRRRPIEFASPAPDGPSARREQAKKLADELGNLEELFRRFTLAEGIPADAEHPLNRLRGRAHKVAASVRNMAAEGDAPAGVGEKAFFVFQDGILLGIKGFIGNIVHPAELSGETLSALARTNPDAAEILERYIGVNGKRAVLAYPNADLWDPAQLEIFYQAIQRVESDVRAQGAGVVVTGVPVMVHRSIEKMVSGFGMALLWIFVAVLILVTIDLRSPLTILFGFLPIAVALTWTAGMAAGLGVHLNMANFFVVPMLLGISIDNGIHMIHRWRQDPDEAVAAGTTGSAVFLVAVSNLIGFVSLCWSSHRGLASLGYLFTIGSIMCMMTSVVFLPVLLGWAGKRRKPAGRLH
jgi:uncharacterized protein